MSSYTIQGGAVLKAQVKLTTTAPTPIIADRSAIIIGIRAANLGSGTPTLAYYVDDGTEQVYQRGGGSMTAWERWQDDLILPIADDEEFVVVAGTANQIDITVIYLPGDRTASG